ncbi:MAG: hypothetical protein P8J33_16245 [Pirellulaceae bacterium]|nr:hypothetical protein [Pirellulaceae bacterium]
MYQDYHKKDVNFYYVYKSLAHPEVNGFVAPHTLSERLKHIAEFQKITGSQVPWLCDSMEGALARAFGNAPNGEFVINPQGEVIRQRFWSNPVTLRADLAKLIGPVNPATTAQQALPAFKMPHREIASGVVPRLKLPADLQPLPCQIQPSEFPAYAKLRAEATPGLFTERGSGKMYLGIYLDPLYQVHWNNRAGNVSVQIEVADGMEISQANLVGPAVEADADLDPRMFLVDLQRKTSLEKTISVALTYTVCDDADTFCQTFSQSYEIELRGDRRLGSRPGIFMPSMFARAADLDRDGNGLIEGSEFPANRATLFLSHMDNNLDGAVDQDELKAFMALFNDGRGFDSPYDDGKNPNKDP